VEIGIDIIEIERIERILLRFPSAKYRLFTDGEIAYCEKRRYFAKHYAARFAAKESVIKVLGVSRNDSIRFRDIEVVVDQEGKPSVKLYGDALALFWNSGGGELTISLSHGRDYAVATALLSG